MRTDNIELLLIELNTYKRLKKHFTTIAPPKIDVVINGTFYVNPHFSKELVPIVERHILNSITKIENEIRRLTKEQWI